MLTGINLYIRSNTLSFKVPIFGYLTISHHASKTHTHTCCPLFLTIFNMFLTISQAKASVEAAKNYVYKGGNFSSEVHIILSKLHNAMCAYWKIPQPPSNKAQVKKETTSNSIDNWTFDSSSNWTNNENEEYK
jgi:hypothetical protein